MSFPLASRLFFDDDVGEDDADDFDIDFDEDYESLSDEEFEVSIEEDEYDSPDFDISGEDFCLDDDFDMFGDFDPSESAPPEKDYADEE